MQERQEPKKENILREGLKMTYVALSVSVYLGGIFYMLWNVDSRSHRTEAEIQSEKEEIGKIKFLCELKTICSQYMDIKYSCASAGSYDNCMSIRLTYTIYSKAKTFCLPDGSINFGEQGIPGFFQCEIAAFR